MVSDIPSITARSPLITVAESSCRRGADIDVDYRWFRVQWFRVQGWVQGFRGSAFGSRFPNQLVGDRPTADRRAPCPALLSSLPRSPGCLNDRMKVAARCL